MVRTAAGVIVGYLLWTLLWLGGNALFFGAATDSVAAGRPYTATGGLIGLLLLSIVCSIAAGVTTTIISKRQLRTAALALAVLLLATGIAVQSGVWALMPLWYHLTFLALIIPVTLLAAGLVRRSQPSVFSRA